MCNNNNNKKETEMDILVVVENMKGLILLVRRRVICLINGMVSYDCFKRNVVYYLGRNMLLSPTQFWVYLIIEHDIIWSQKGQIVSSIQVFPVKLIHYAVAQS